MSYLPWLLYVRVSLCVSHALATFLCVQTSKGLVVMETTESVFNNSLYDLIKPRDCVMSWVRVVVANALAKSSSTWASVFSDLNSGTYNNMWYDSLDLFTAVGACHVPYNDELCPHCRS